MGEEDSSNEGDADGEEIGQMTIGIGDGDDGGTKVAVADTIGER